MIYCICGEKNSIQFNACMHVGLFVASTQLTIYTISCLKI